MSWLDNAAWLQQLQNAQQSPSSQSGTVIDDLQLSGGKLELSTPSYYKAHPQEQSPFEIAVELDASGAVDRHNDFCFTILSPDQKLAAVPQSRSFLQPLIDQIYNEGNRTLETFTQRHFLQGEADCRRGNQSLRNLFESPARFTPGPYALCITLDTPDGMVAAANHVADTCQDLQRNPYLTLDKPRMLAAADNATRLRSEMPDLDTHHPYPTNFRVETPAAILPHQGQDVYFLYRNGKNYVIHLGASPFRRPPVGLSIINGSNSHSALIRLVKEDLLRLSKATADANGKRLKKAAAQFPSLGQLADEIASISTSLPTEKSNAISRTYLDRISPQALEFIITPTIKTPVMTTLCKRLSMSRAIRTYWHLGTLKAAFATGIDSALSDVARAASVSDIQNAEANQWLYQQHREACQAHELTFDHGPKDQYSHSQT